MARPKKPDRFVCIEERERGDLRFRVHAVKNGRRTVESFRTAEEAEEAKGVVTRATARLGTPTVEALLERYFEEMVARRKWRREAKAYASKTGALKTFLAPVADMPIGTVGAVHVDRCCKAWDTPGRSAEWTRHNARVRARAFFGWAVASKLVKVSPMDDTHMVPKPKGQLGAMRMDDARQLRGVLDPAAACGDHSAIFVLAALLLGARTSELLGLRKSSLDDEGRVVTYADAKSPSTVYRVRMPAVLAGPMRRLAEEADDEERLFDTYGRWPQTWGARAVRHWAKQAGLDGVEKMDARWMRRTKDTLAVEAGVSSEVVARETGHSLRIAQVHYIQHGTETARGAAAMDEMTRIGGTDSENSGTASAKVAK